jgi:SnoaL-like polyketide cyclase
MRLISVSSAAAIPFVVASLALIWAPTDRSGNGPPTLAVAEVVDRYDLALERHDWSALEDLVAPTFAFNNTDFGSSQERHGFLVWARVIGDSYPDFLVAVDRIDVFGQVAVIAFHERNRGAAAGCHRRGTDAAGVFGVRVVDGQIVEMWSNYDEFGPLPRRCRPAA